MRRLMAFGLLLLPSALAVGADRPIPQDAQRMGMRSRERLASNRRTVGEGFQGGGKEDPRLDEQARKTPGASTGRTAGTDSSRSPAPKPAGPRGTSRPASTGSTPGSPTSEGLTPSGSPPRGNSTPIGAGTRGQRPSRSRLAKIGSAPS